VFKSKSILHQFNLKQNSLKAPESSEYKIWRDRFLRKRLRLCLLLTFPCLLTYTAYDLSLYSFEWNWNRWVEADFARIFFALISGILYKTKWGQNNFQWVLLCISWSITMFPNLIMIYRGLPAPSDIPLNMVFITQTTLMPIYWKIHLTSLIGAIISHWIAHSLKVDSDLDLGLSIIYWFWISFVCTLAVYLYEQLQRQEFESRRELNIFLHSVSHDLRSPVTGSTMVLQNLLKKETSADEILVRRSILQQLLQGSDRQLKMINSLFEAQRTSAQGIILNYQPCNLERLIQAIILELEPILQKNAVLIDNRILDDLPEVHADPVQLWRVFNNLITNALKHNPPGIKLYFDAVIDPDFIKILVADNGVGIALQQQTRLFELYTRGDRARYMPGLGLGLYLSQEIITAHNGAIGVQSTPGQGSTFWFTLPY
jgi:signal transduction histidine kinase